MVGRAARLLAPIVIIAVAASIYLIVHATVDNHHTVTHSSAASHKRHHKHKDGHRPKYYVVKAGDTLSGIASRTGVSLNRLERLNPNVSPNALQTGRRLRLRQ